MTAVKSLPYTEEALEAELGKRSLHAFARMAWPIVDPTAPFTDGWHIRELCKVYEACARGEAWALRLIVNIPPGHSKTLLSCVLLPAWVWTWWPEFRWVFTSYGDDLSKDAATKCRNLTSDPWYTLRWPHAAVEPKSAVKEFENASKGFRRFTSVGGSVTGRHVNAVVGDDLLKAEDARSALSRERAWRHWSEGLASRIAGDPSEFRMIMIGQRLHEDDPPGRAHETGDYYRVRFPARFEAGEPDPLDHRSEDGELLWPARYDEDAVSRLERTLGAWAAAAQLQQRPSPEGGVVFSRSWLEQEWNAIPARATYVQSWDMSFKDLESSDWVVGQLWAKFRGQFYLVDEIRERLDFPSTLAAVQNARRRDQWRKARKILIEDKANGTAIIQTLKSNGVPGVIPVNPQGGKESRAIAASAYFEAGDVLLPPEQFAPWLSEYREELATFPTAKHDDRVDATSQAILYLAEAKGSARAPWSKVLAGM